MSILHVLYVSILYSDDGSTTKDVPGFLSAYGEEPFKSGTGTFHPAEQADSASIKSDVIDNENVNSQPLNPADAYDKLPPPRKASNGDLDGTYDKLPPPRKASNEDLDTQPLHPPDTYDKLSPQKVSCSLPTL